jgi:DNA-binding Lrp family transcriptional regulator
MAVDREAIDELDRRIAARLAMDGRESNRSLAAALDVNQATITARLRRMANRDQMRVVAVTDIEAFGFSYHAFVLINTFGRPSLDVARDLARLPELMSVNVTSGPADIVARVLAHDRNELARVLGEVIPAVPGVQSVSSEWAAELIRYGSRYTTLGADSDHLRPLPLPDGLDSLDGRLIEFLRRDARASNRSIGATLGVSEGTIRMRIRRLQQDGFIRIQAICDSRAFGPMSTAFVGLQAFAGQVTELRAGLEAFDGLPLLVRTIGSFDFVMLVRTSSHDEYLGTLRERLARLPGLGAIHAFEIESTLKHDYSWTLVR